ncbi:MAG: hypothetical protein H6Q33_652 [Deltaproteobacteria bacterium]|nr:hypothetical protein [Deltaproteobacteria bacterium]
MRRSRSNGLCEKDFRSPFDKLRVSGNPCAAGTIPLMLSSSKHERPLGRPLPDIALLPSSACDI